MVSANLTATAGRWSADAFHYKDPLDGQGIYDAMVEAKALSEEIVLWINGEKSWEQAVSRTANAQSPKPSR